MPPMLFTTLVGLLFNLLLAGVMPQTGYGVAKLNAVAHASHSASVNT
jgi:hypothetical protein